MTSNVSNIYYQLKIPIFKQVTVEAVKRDQVVKSNERLAHNLPTHGSALLLCICCGHVKCAYITWYDIQQRTCRQYGMTGHVPQHDQWRFNETANDGDENGQWPSSDKRVAHEVPDNPASCTYIAHDRRCCQSVSFIFTPNKQ
jgi:hypothetical protein